jgi:hypothetical protein
MSTEFDKNISDYKNDIDFFLRLAKWPKITVKKSQNFQKPEHEPPKLEEIYNLGTIQTQEV